MLVFYNADRRIQMTYIPSHWRTLPLQPDDALPYVDGRCSLQGWGDNCEKYSF